MRSKLGMSHIPEDRQKYGLVLDYTLEENLVLQRYYEPEFQKGGFIRKDNVRKYADKLIKQYDIRSGQGPVTPARSMSGGNQQKAIVAREIDKTPNSSLRFSDGGLDVARLNTSITTRRRAR
jgi:simple sugar transport system ATP-binding protein